MGRVIYNWNRQSLQETLPVTLRLTTFEYGKVCLDEGNILNSDIVHMDFHADFQDYSFDEEGFLIIKGKSGRLGAYEVKLREV